MSLEKKEQKQPAFLAINPSGKIPALRLAEGEIITESAAILLTLADHFPQARLLPPQASNDRALAYRWLAFMAGEIYPIVEIVDYPERFTPDGGDAEAVREIARDRIRERILIIERMIKGPFLLAPELFDPGYLCGDVHALEPGAGLETGEPAQADGAGGRGVTATGDCAGLAASEKARFRC